MGHKHFENKARRSFWLVHIRAWQQSGLTRTAYCREHRLNKSTFDRWLKALDALESARIKARERRKRTHEPISKDRHNKAVQAFWAMHVEALNWSGLTAKAYAMASPPASRRRSATTWCARSTRCRSAADRLASAPASECPADRKHQC